MRGRHYRLKSPTLAILTGEDDHKIPITIPQGADIEVLAETNGNQLIDVLWEGKPLMMFTIDLRNRGERLEPARAIISA